MQIWYDAVCDNHKELCTIMVDSPVGTAPYVSDESNLAIKQWLIEHSSCKLRLICSDEDLDFCFENNYTRKVKLF